jgi:hypothetical protein
MRQGLSWVEWTGFALVAIALTLFLFSDWLAPFLATGPPAVLFISGPGIAAAGLILVAIWIAAMGLSLFFGRPLLLLGARAPVWLIAPRGIAVLAFYDPVCRALSPGDIHSEALSDCRFGLPALGGVLIPFGIILVIRQFQVFRKRAG